LSLFSLFLFFLSFSFSSVFFSLSPFSLKQCCLCFSFFPLFFLSFFPPRHFHPSPLVFIRGKQGREGYYPCPVMA
jgi:hypothetical protein